MDDLERDTSRCGTPRGYKWHKNHGETVCDNCQSAHAAYSRAWYLANKDRLALQRRRAAEARWKLAA